MHQQILAAVGTPTWTQTFSTTLTTNGGNWAGGFTTRIVIPSSALTQASQIRFTLRGNSATSFTMLKARVGLAATSGHPYDFDGSPITVTGGGSSSFVIPAGGDIVTDPAFLTIPPGRNVVFAWYATTGAGRYVTAPSGWADYYQSGDHVDVVDTTADGTEGRLYFIRRVECVGA
jgi:hypothetical protein